MEWKDIKGFEGYYQVSETGLVRSLDRYVKYKHGGKDRFWPGVLIKPYLGSSGYYQISLKVSSKISRRMVHRLVAAAFIENHFNLPQVNHLDGDKLNNCFINLEWCDQFDNIQHAFKTGRHSGVGRSHYKAKTIIDKEKKVIYDTLQEASEATGFSRKVLSDMLTGKSTNKTSLRYSYIL